MIDVADFDTMEELLAEIERKDKLRELSPYFYDIAENFSDIDEKINKHPTIQNIRSTKVQVRKNDAIFKIIHN